MPLVTWPNTLEASDYDGWVQERGLQFAAPWDSAYSTVYSSNDPNEPKRDGGLITMRHGRGTFIYTGYAFFRQVPAGVPGAWRLFANLVSRRVAGEGVHPHRAAQGQFGSRGAQDGLTVRESAGGVRSAGRRHSLSGDAFPRTSGRPYFINFSSSQFSKIHQ